MHKIIASLALASFAAAVGGCDQPVSDAAHASSMAAAAVPATQMMSPLPGVEDVQEWQYLDRNQSGRHFIDKASYEAADWTSSDSWAMFKTVYDEPVGPVASLETMMEFNCQQGIQRSIVHNTYDADGNRLRTNDEPTEWIQPDKGTIGELYQKAACIPIGVKGG